MLNPWRQPHIIRTTKSLLKALYLTIGIFLATFVIFHIGSAFHTSNVSMEQLNAFNDGIKTEKIYLKRQGDIISKNSLLIDSLIKKDRNSLLEIIKNERDARHIGLMGVADAEGVMIGRTKSVNKYGDNVFLTAPAGRVVSQGKSVETIELTSFGNQIYMNTGRPIMNNGLMVGALFANHLLDDDFANRFKNRYLSHDSEVVFYTKPFGVYGNSFSDQETRKLINSYFNSGSDWIKNGESNKTISFGNSSSYFIVNVVFPGLEQSPGGALIFIPRKDISNFANCVISFITILAFLLFAYHQHIKSRGEERGWRYYVLLFGSMIIVFFLTFFAIKIQNVGRTSLQHIPYTLYNSTIRLQPESGVYNIGFEQSFTIVVDTGDEPINVVQVKLNFDPEAVEFKSIDVGTSTCSYVAENNINQNAGTATLTCGILDFQPGRKSISIADIYIIPKRIGSVGISFDTNETKVLANDGLGTNVLRMSQDSSYRFDNFDTDPDNTATTTGAEQPFVLFSPTHPNESRWYSSREAHFVWIGKAHAVYHYTFDTAPDTIPTSEHIVQGTNADVKVPGDGIYYFHLQLASGGPIAHYKIKSDMSPPTILTMNLSKDEIYAGDVVRFSFNAEDSISGIQKNYYVDLGDHLFLPIGQELFVPFLEAGDQKITLRVYDGAGNYTEKSQIIQVEDK